MIQQARSEAEFDTRSFRNALGCYATGVTVVTTVRENGKPEGLTVNSFASVSLKPPLVLWSLLSSSKCLSAFRDAPYFAVNVLASDQEHLSIHFGRPFFDKFGAESVPVLLGLGGLPLLAGAAAWFECRKEFCTYGGDHVVLFGSVERYRQFDREPLIFHRGRYSRLK